MKIQPIILAAGKGTRMQTELPKPLFPMDGKPMIRLVLEALEGDEGCLPAIVVVGYGGEHIRAELGDGYRYAEQTELTGTATAVKATLPLLSDENPILVLYGDNPFITTASVKRMREAFASHRTVMAMFSVELPDYQNWRSVFTAFGRVKRDRDGKVIGVVEYKNATPEEREIKEVTPGGNCIDVKWLCGALPRIKPHPNTGEYYLTELTEIAILDGGEVATVPLPPEEAVGINSVEDAEQAKRRQ